MIIKLRSAAQEEDEAKARQEVKDGDWGYLLIIPAGMASLLENMIDQEPVNVTLVYDRASLTAPAIIGNVQRYIEEANKRIVQAPTLLALQPEGVQSRKLTYFDFMLPGLVGMGVMTYSIIGVASVITLYREQKILKRITRMIRRRRDVHFLDAGFLKFANLIDDVLRRADHAARVDRLRRDESTLFRHVINSIPS